MATIFSRIIAWEVPSYKIYEDEYTFAFLDIHPTALGHTLIVPKIEVDYFVDVPEPFYTAVFQVAKKLAPAIQRATGCKRISTLIAGFEVHHFHYHLIPTNSLAEIQSGKSSSASPQDLEMMQQKILEELENTQQ